MKRDPSNNVLHATKYQMMKKSLQNDIIDNSNNAIMCVLRGEQLTKQKKTLKIYAKKGIKNEIDYRQRRQHVIIDILPQKRQTPKRYQKKL